jgi:hypothetical protein
MKNAGNVALGGMLAAAALVVMCLGGLIPFSTFICPTVCIMVLQIVLQLTAKQIGAAWYGTVSILCVLLAPDKEAAAVFVCLGYYPLLKPVFEKWPVPILWKLLLFNSAILLMYATLIYLFGMTYLQQEYTEMGSVMLLIMLALGNVTFWLLDRLLSRVSMLIKKR